MTIFGRNTGQCLSTITQSKVHDLFPHELPVKREDEQGHPFQPHWKVSTPVRSFIIKSSSSEIKLGNKLNLGFRKRNKNQNKNPVRKWQKFAPIESRCTLQLVFHYAAST